MSTDFRSSEQRCWITNIWNHILTRVWLQFQNFKYSLLAFWRLSKSLKICKSEPDLINVTGTFYDWCHLITGFKDAVMHQLPNETTKLLSILFKNLGMVLNAQLQWENWDILKLVVQWSVYLIQVHPRCINQVC